jgi:hypothetical protein
VSHRRYGMHDLIRRYSCDLRRWGSHWRESEQALGRLLDYYQPATPTSTGRCSAAAVRCSTRSPPISSAATRSRRPRGCIRPLEHRPLPASLGNGTDRRQLRQRTGRIGPMAHDCIRTASEQSNISCGTSTITIQKISSILLYLRRTSAVQGKEMLLIAAPGQGTRAPGFLSRWPELPGVAERLAAWSDLASDDLIAYRTTGMQDRSLVRRAGA